MNVTQKNMKWPEAHKVLNLKEQPEEDWPIASKQNKTITKLTNKGKITLNSKKQDHENKIICNITGTVNNCYCRAVSWEVAKHSCHLFRICRICMLYTWTLMQCNVITGSFHFSMQLPEKLENDIKENGKRTEASEDEVKEKKASLVKKKRKQRSVCDEEEQAGPSSQMTTGQGKSRKSKKICFCRLSSADLYFCKYDCTLHNHILYYIVYIIHFEYQGHLYTEHSLWLKQQVECAAWLDQKTNKWKCTSSIPKCWDPF